MNFNLTVVGGGHAGLEAAWIAAELGLKVALITSPNVKIGSTPCNPAIGGVGKGQVVREIDAMGGLMGLLADLSGIQYRTLNESKGYAVQSTRVQLDKDIYASNAEKLITSHKNITVIQKKVDKIERDKLGSFLFFDELRDLIVESDKVVVTTGTFLGGVLHRGCEKKKGGRVGCSSSKDLRDLFANVKTLGKKFKTGTPPRLDKNTINFSKMMPQPSDIKANSFHCLHKSSQRFLPQVECYLTRTNEETLEIIRENKEDSPIFNGQIQGVGPRYCPSIEDKAFRYPDRNTHHVFIEPEGLETQSVYPNGVSTSLPASIQESFIRTISGLENVEFLVHGYAVEYDVVDVTQLDETLQSQDIEGLYFAGQINGTSGYEEAAGQGLIAGINAALSFLGKSPLVFNRMDSYIGVMVGDLTSNKRDEPYRLFTARSENRLFIREDNVINRLAPYRKALGQNRALDKFQSQYLEDYNLLSELCESYLYKKNSKNMNYFNQAGYGSLEENITLAELLKRAHLDPVETLFKELNNFGVQFLDSSVRSVAISKKYAGYIKRASTETEKIQKLSLKKINWEMLASSKNISHECRLRISQIRPSSFGQLRQIEGIRPATLAFVAGNFI
ncbi:MAG: tRNA uridine-5-carboxymethylaminomethyl(34) synthesis enzyme MnmG [Halobacteriovoraceae bacterium]|nr:tRNA uridine-5-carboxymethylaminomethyl(34) synthesis enzyme MnmG [Halobacteriovoraceae bacterium]